MPDLPSVQLLLGLAFDPPRYRLHLLKGDWRGYWAVTVRANWRIVFRFEGGDAVDVELIDYH